MLVVAKAVVAAAANSGSASGGGCSIESSTPATHSCCQAPCVVDYTKQSERYTTTKVSLQIQFQVRLGYRIPTPTCSEIYASRITVYRVPCACTLAANTRAPLLGRAWGSRTFPGSLAHGRCSKVSALLKQDSEH